MPYEWSIDHATRIARISGHGDATPADTVRVIEEVRAALPDSARYDLVYNSLDLRIEAGPADVMNGANALFRDAGARFRSVALVVPPSRVTLASIFAALAQPFGISANVFGDEDEARDWLAERAEKKRERRVEAIKLPVEPEGPIAESTAHDSSAPLPNDAPHVEAGAPDIEPEQ